MKSYRNLQRLSLVILLAASCITLSAQNDNDDLKLQNLKNKLTMAEEKVAAAEAKVARADSLINHGDESIAAAEEQFAAAGEDQKMLEKEFNAEVKRLSKLSKSKNEEEAAKAEADLKALEKKFNADMKVVLDRIKQLTKQAEKGEADMAKGREMQKDALSRLKDAQKALELAQENYDSYLGSTAE